MKEFKDKTAVITGAASGIGFALAKRCVQEGMKVVLADIESEPLFKAEKELKATSESILAVKTDVSKLKDIELLAQKTIDAFGAVHLLINNAGVAAAAYVWENTQNDWKWVLGVNLWGVIHGIRIFVPIMINQDTKCRIINTASVAGLTCANSGIYTVTKHAIIALSETLHQSLTLAGTKIKVSVLCPGWVKTKIMDSERNRPKELMNDPSEILDRPELEFVREAYRNAVENGMAPTEVANITFQAIRENRFYILTHIGPNWMGMIRQRKTDILEGNNPVIFLLDGSQMST